MAKYTFPQIRDAMRDYANQGITQDVIGEIFGVKRGYVSHVLTGRAHPRKLTLEGLSERLAQVKAFGIDETPIFAAESERPSLWGTPRRKADIATVKAYQAELKRFRAGEPHNLDEFAGRKVKLVRDGKPVTIQLETNPARLQEMAEQGYLDRIRDFGRDSG
jgi:transcriptional regulator with XRE-family HTH domain